MSAASRVNRLCSLAWVVHLVAAVSRGSDTTVAYTVDANGHASAGPRVYEADEPPLMRSQQAVLERNIGIHRGGRTTDSVAGEKSIDGVLRIEDRVRHAAIDAVAPDKNVGLWRSPRQFPERGGSLLKDPLVIVLSQEVADLKRKVKESELKQAQDVYENSKESDGEGSDNETNRIDGEASFLEKADSKLGQNSSYALAVSEGDDVRFYLEGWRRRRRRRRTPGAQGKQGDAGSQGQEGDMGPKGDQGITGKAGPPGPDGKCSLLELNDKSGHHPERSPPDHMPAAAPTPDALYQLREEVATLRDKYIKSQEEHTSGCDRGGPKGGTGVVGDPGAFGKDGAKGPVGDPGEKGPPGKAGKDADCSDSLLRMEAEYEEEEEQEAQKQSELKRLRSDVRAIQTSLADLSSASVHQVAGSPGCQGEKGTKGDPGGKGKTGAKGNRGPPGAVGDTGPPGKSDKNPTTVTTTKVVVTTAAAVIKSAAPRVVPVRVLITCMVAALAAIFSTS